MKKENSKKENRIIDWKDMTLLFLAFAILIMQGLMTKQENAYRTALADFHYQVNSKLEDWNYVAEEILSNETY